MTNNSKEKYNEWQEQLGYDLLSYSKIEHRQLLNEKKEYIIEILDEDNNEIIGGNKRIFSKLINYNIIAIRQLRWVVQEQYFEILKDYIDERMNVYTFQSTFSKRYKSIDDLAGQLKSNRVFLCPDINCLEFGLLMEKIDEYCNIDVSSSNPNVVQSNYEIDEVQFRSAIEKLYLETQNLLSNA